MRKQIYNQRNHYPNRSTKQFNGSLRLQRPYKYTQVINEIQRQHLTQYAKSENNAKNPNNALNLNNLQNVYNVQNTNNPQNPNSAPNQNYVRNPNTPQKPRPTPKLDPRASDTVILPHLGLSEYLLKDKKRREKERRGKETDPMGQVLYYAGEIGWYQWYLFGWMLPFGMFFAWVYFVQMFITAVPATHYCWIPELANMSQEKRRNLSTPIMEDGLWDRCHAFDVDWKDILHRMRRPDEWTPITPCKHGWEYEYTDIPYPTVASERNWVCSNAKNVPIAQAIFFIGALLGCFGFGWMADHYGRIPALMGSNLCGAIGGVATVFTRGYWDFVICRFISGLALDNNFMLIYILALEYVGVSHRTLLANIAYAVYYGGGNVTLPWMAYFAHSWRKTLWMTSLPMFIVLLAPWFMPESARWLVSRGQIDEAVRVLTNFAAVNGNKIPEATMKEFVKSANNELSEHVEESLYVIFHSGPLCHTAIYMLIVYCGCGIVYDALVRLSEAFGLDFFVTFTLTGCLEIPAVLLLAVFLDRFGRRNLTWVPLFISGITICGAMFVAKGLPRVCCAAVARFFMHMAFTAATQWSTEILPTPFRASGSAALHMSAFAACLVSPFIVYSRLYWSLLPYVILSVISIIIAGVTLLLPETKGVPMPQTIPESEDLIARNCLFKHVTDAPRRPSRFSTNFLPDADEKPTPARPMSIK